MEVLLDTCRRRRLNPLLLLHLFVMNAAAADCPKPQGSRNMVLTNEALLVNVFPEGSKVTFECANGYVKVSGPGIATCIQGGWSEPDLICKKKDCGPPKPQPNMSFNTNAGTLFGAVIEVVCDKGYQISGSSYKQCYATGWTGKAKCGIAICETPGKVANGRSSWNSQDYPKYGENIHYVCNEGYTLVGKNTIVCGETGEYDSQPPECKGATTEDIIATKMVTPTSTPPAPEVSTSAASSATPTAHRAKPISTSAAPTVSLSAQGGRGILAPEDTTASVTTATSFQDKHDGAVATNKDVGHAPVIISVICISIGVVIVIGLIYRYLVKRKGSYDTREDLKPELLQFQIL